jgi:phospholipase C
MSTPQRLVRGAFPALLLTATLALLTPAAHGETPAAAATAPEATAAATSGHGTTTPIEHVVVIFQENVSFDHYFGTYPNAANMKGESVFRANGGTPSVNGLAGPLADHNPNSATPFRLSRAQNYTCDENHDYTPEQKAVNGGLLDSFPENVGNGTSDCDFGHGAGLTMGYYDGSTVTALWNYAQHFALNDNSYGSTFGPSTVGALNLVAGQTGNVDSNHTRGSLTDSTIGTTVIGDPDPFYDDCGAGTQVAVTGTNIGDLLNAAGLTWGWFEGGFAPSSRNADGTAVCASKTANVGGILQTDYSAHHEPFQYFAQSANPHHLPPSSVAAIGRTDQANHQYDLTNFFAALRANNLPAVTFLKAKKAQDGHAGYSSPLDEQIFLATVINALQQNPVWRTTAVFIMYDDSDGWYDHAMSPIVNPSATTADALSGNGACGSGTPLGGIQGRCGYGPRLPMLVVSPYAKVNFVDHTTTDQSSAIRFIEDNWSLGRVGGGSFDEIAGPLTNMFDFHHLHTAPLLINPNTGVVTP